MLGAIVLAILLGSLYFIFSFDLSRKGMKKFVLITSLVLMTLLSLLSQSIPSFDGEMTYGFCTAGIPAILGIIIGRSPKKGEKR